MFTVVLFCDRILIMSNLMQNLETFGFEPREVKIYTFLLSNRDLPVYKIATEVDIPRTTTYKILESLKKQGFVSSWIKNGVKYFSAESPDRLKDLAQKKQDALQNAMPEIMGLFDTKSIYPKAKLYLGKEGVKHTFELILESAKINKTQIIYAYTDNLLTKQLPVFFKEWRDRKNKETGSYTQLIVPHGTPMSADYGSDEYRETRMMPEEFSFAGSIDICDKMVCFFSFHEKEVYSIVVESPIVTEMLKKIFQYVWKTLE
jgi:sugar-specific transcriptional regulator TrmB